MTEKSPFFKKQSISFTKSEWDLLLKLIPMLQSNQDAPVTYSQVVREAIVTLAKQKQIEV